VHYFVPARRSTTNLLQSTGELWLGEAEEAPVPVAVLARGDALGRPGEGAGGTGAAPGWLAPVLRALAEVGPDDMAFGHVATAGLPEVSAGDAAGEAVGAFREALAEAEGILVLVDDVATGTVEVGRALGWAALPAGEGLLAGLPVAVLGVAGERDALTAAVETTRALVRDGGGELVDGSAEALPGPWAGRVDGSGRVEDVATRQVLGQAALRLRHAVDAWGDEDGSDDVAAPPDPGDVPG
jgi:hypothetical protein